MKRIVAFALVLACLLSTVALADTVEVQKKDQGAVNEVLYKQFGRKLETLFTVEIGPALAVGMAAVPIEMINSKFHFNFNKSKEPIAYIGQASGDGKILFMALMDKSKKFLLVSVIPAKDYMAYESNLVSKKDALGFMQTYCGDNYVGISYELMKEANDAVGSN